MTLLEIPPILQYFFQIIYVNLRIVPKEQKKYIKATVCAILFHQEKVSMRIIGSILPKFKRAKSSVSKMYSSSNNFCQEVAWQSTMIMCKISNKRLPLTKKKTPWVLIFDTTHRSRFGKCLESLIGTHGANSKRRFFPCVWSMLISPTGNRIAIPCPAWYSKEYAKKNKIKYKTQTALAIQTFKWLTARLEKYSLQFDLVIVADSAFDSLSLWKICAAHNEKNLSTWTFITSCSVERCLGRNGPKSSRITGKKVCQQFFPSMVCSPEKIDVQSITQIDVRSEVKASTQKKMSFYRHVKQILRVSSIGDANVVMSYKLKKANQSLHLSPVKFLLCSNLNFQPQSVIAYYSLRWEIETFFREQKSDLGFCDFQAWNPLSSYRFIHHLTITFNFLEFFRLSLLDFSDFPMKDELLYIRTRRLKELFRKRSFYDQLSFIVKSLQTPYGVRKLKERMYSFSDFHFFTNCQRTLIL